MHELITLGLLIAGNLVVWGLPLLYLWERR